MSKDFKNFTSNVDDVLDSLQDYLDGYQVNIGVKEVKLKKAKKEKKPFAGGVARKVGGYAKTDIGMTELGVILEEQYGFFTKPFEPENKDPSLSKAYEIVVKDFFESSSQANKRRIENTAQAFIRNPILRQEYGLNTDKRAKQKGFNRLGIDTGQFFNSIEAKIDAKG